MRLRKPENDILNRLLKVANDSLALFGQPPLYAETQEAAADEEGTARRPSRKPSRQRSDYRDYSHCFHISLAWSLSEPSETDVEMLQKLNLDGLKEMAVVFNSVKAKIGNKVSSVALLTKHT